MSAETLTWSLSLRPGLPVARPFPSPQSMPGLNTWHSRSTLIPALSAWRALPLPLTWPIVPWRGNLCLQLVQHLLPPQRAPLVQPADSHRQAILLLSPLWEVLQPEAHQGSMGLSPTQGCELCPRLFPRRVQSPCEFPALPKPLPCLCMTGTTMRAGC